jgi:hypothetical protein
VTDWCCANEFLLLLLRPTPRCPTPPSFFLRHNQPHRTILTLLFKMKLHSFSKLKKPQSWKSNRPESAMAASHSSPGSLPLHTDLCALRKEIRLLKLDPSQSPSSPIIASLSKVSMVSLLSDTILRGYLIRVGAARQPRAHHLLIWPWHNRQEKSLCCFACSERQEISQNSMDWRPMY